VALCIPFFVYLRIMLLYIKGSRSARKLRTEHRIMRRVVLITACRIVCTIGFICIFAMVDGTAYLDVLIVCIVSIQASTTNLLTVESYPGFCFELGALSDSTT
jgi:hypothetical protein